MGRSCRMLSVKRVLTAVMLLVSLLTASTLLAADPDTIPARKDYADVAARLQRFIEHELHDKQLPAISVALVDRDQIVWARGFGFADPEKKVPATATTVYRVGSVSKLFTDIGVMQMVEQGKLDLDAPVAKYLPDFKPVNQFSKPITLRQLMSHRSGLLREPPIGNYFDPSEPTLADTVHSLNGLPLVYAPETRLKYSNAAIGVVGYSLEFLNKRPFAEYLKEKVLEPLGMKSSAFEPSPEIKSNLAKGYMWTYDGRVFEAPGFQLGMSPAGSMYSTVTDLSRFVIVLLNGGRGPNGVVIKPGSLQKMWEPQLAPGGGYVFGLGFILDKMEGHRIVGHGGAIYGFATEVEAMPEDKLGAVVVTTMDGANPVAVHIAREALRLMLAVRAGKPLPEISISHPVSADLVHRLSGRYGEGDATVDLIERNGGLYLRKVNGGREMRLQQDRESLIVDDRLGYGTKVYETDGTIRIGDTLLKRTAPAQHAPTPEGWKGLIGEYGWDHDILYITERDGHLTTLIEWYEYEPLEQISTDVFKYPPRGLYDGEEVVFTRDANGKATQVRVGGVTFKRRSTNGQR